MSLPQGGIAHWDEVDPIRVENDALGATVFDLGRAAGSIDVGVRRFRVDPGKQSAPFHLELAEEEIFFVLGGTGFLRQGDATYEVRSGDCIVHRVGEEPHTLVGGADGLDVLAFGERAEPSSTWLPRPRVLRDAVAFRVPRIDPFALEAEHGVVELGEPVTPRAANIVALEEVPPDDDGEWRGLAAAAGSVRSGLNHQIVAPGNLNCPPHCHSLESELFVVLDGDGTLELTPSPSRADHGVEPEQHPVRAGTVVSRPASTRIAHAFRAGGVPLTLLCYGTRRPNDICWYPRSRKIFFRGVGVIARIEHVAYEVGEESPR